MCCCCDQVVFFAISLIMLLWVLNDEKVETREASMLLAGYLVRLDTYEPAAMPIG